MHTGFGWMDIRFHSSHTLRWQIPSTHNRQLVKIKTVKEELQSYKHLLCSWQKNPKTLMLHVSALSSEQSSSVGTVKLARAVHGLSWEFATSTRSGSNPFLPLITPFFFILFLFSLYTTALRDLPKHCLVQGPPQYHSPELSSTQGPLPSAKQCMKPHSLEKSFPVTKALSCLCIVSLSHGEIHLDLTPWDTGVLLSLVMNHPRETVAGDPIWTTPVSESEIRITSSLQTCRAPERHPWVF